MAFCTNCGNQLLDTDIFCPSCGYKTPLKIQEIDRRKHFEEKAGIIVDVGTSGLFGGAIVIFGVLFMTMAIIVGFIKLNASFLNAMIGMFWGIAIGGIAFKIGNWLVNKIENNVWRTRTLQASVIIGIILGITQVPYYLEIVNGFY